MLSLYFSSSSNLCTLELLKNLSLYPNNYSKIFTLLYFCIRNSSSDWIKVTPLLEEGRKRKIDGRMNTTPDGIQTYDLLTLRRLLYHGAATTATQKEFKIKI